MTPFFPPLDTWPAPFAEADTWRVADVSLATAPVAFAQSVVAALDKLPATRHDLASFTADVFILPPVKGSQAQMCMLTIKGNMQEKTSEGQWKDRLFHRTFILISPAPQDSLSAGWQIAICNDQVFIPRSPLLQALHHSPRVDPVSPHSASASSLPPHPPCPPRAQIDIRNAPHRSTSSASSAAAAPLQMPTAAAQQSPAALGFPPQGAPQPAGLSSEQMQCCQQLAAQCPGVTLDLAARCLAENAWQVQQAVPIMQQFLARGVPNPGF